MRVLLVVLLIAAIAFAVWTYRDRIPLVTKPEPRKFDTGPVRVVGQRPGGSRRAPGAKLSEPEAVMTLRQHLAGRVEKSECLALASRGHEGDVYLFDAVDSCRRTKLGRFRVDGSTGRITER